MAAGVALETALPGHFSDNGVHVLPWAPRTLTFTAATTAATAAVTPRRLQESLTMQARTARHPHSPPTSKCVNCVAGRRCTPALVSP